MEKPDGYHEHHRQLRRGGDERAVNKLWVSNEVHDWIHKNPEEARKLGWLVSQYEDPADVIVTIPDRVAKTRAKRATGEARKKRVNTTIKTPKDEENVLPEMIDATREHLAPKMGWEHDVPAYFVIVAALAVALQE